MTHERMTQEQIDERIKEMRRRHDITSIEQAILLNETRLLEIESTRVKLLEKNDELKMRLLELEQ
jgi:hypothetical protein